MLSNIMYPVYGNNFDKNALYANMIAVTTVVNMMQ